MLKNLAIVVAPAPPTPPAQEGCAYQIRIDSYNTYQCLTQAQWNARQEEQAAHDAQVRAEFTGFLDYCAVHWWVIVLFVVGIAIVQQLWRWKHPEPPNFYI